MNNIRGRGENQRITKQSYLEYLSRKGGTSVEAMPPAVPVRNLSTPSPAPQPAQPPFPAPAVSPAGTQPGRAPGVDHEIVPMDHVRKRIAEHMIISKQTSAHVTSVAEVDVTPLVQYREGIKRTFEAREGFPLTYTAFFIEAAARALREFPLINASLDGDKIIIKKSIHIGIAVGLEDKLIVPVIRDAGRLNLRRIAAPLMIWPPGRATASSNRTRCRANLLHYQHRHLRQPLGDPDHQSAPGGHSGYGARSKNGPSSSHAIASAR